MCSLVDAYGFVLCGLTDDERAARERNLRRSNRDATDWKGAAERGGRRLKERIRRGIPFSARPEIWWRLSGAERLMATYPGKYYSSLVTQLGRPRGEVLDAETLRRFQPNLGIQGMEIVRRILSAFELHSGADVGGGNAAIVAFLLMVMGIEREEDVFWMYVSLLETKLFGNAAYKV